MDQTSTSRTSHSLLARLRTSQTSTDWNRFVELYTPILYRWATRAGLSDQDALDLVQEVMVTLLQKLPEFTYNPQLKFRSWLKTLLMNRVRDRFRRQKTAPAVGGAAADELSSPDDDRDSFWEQEHRALLIQRALEIMRGDFEEKTWRACWLTTVENKKPAEVAAELGITENAVYIARHRVLRHLRAELADLLD